MSVEVAYLPSAFVSWYFKLIYVQVLLGKLLVLAESAMNLQSSFFPSSDNSFLVCSPAQCWIKKGGDRHSFVDW